ncbi:hypothetical protein ASC63_14655 [Leifsonia sp. Root112D2]|nr:hypothetical protein ASC63_14655 [Leifsonia sp. Root112D2]
MPVMSRKDRLNDTFHSDSKAYAHLRNLDPEMPDHVWSVIIRYRPQLSEVQWVAVREFTLTNVILMNPRTFESARRLMTMTARFTAWVWAATGTELTAPRVYTQNHVYRYLNACMSGLSEPHRWGVVRQLGVIAETLADTQVKRLPAPHLPGRRPFTLSEVATMHSWAGTLSTSLKRQNAWGILGLAGGAGLRTEEIAETCVRDVEIVEGRVLVNVRGRRPRRVPVMQPWDRTMLRAIEGRAPDAFVFHGYRLDEYRPRTIQSFLTENPARVRPTVSRLRSTWIIAHIDNGIPLSVLMSAAGFLSPGSLEKHLRHAKTRNLEDFTGLLIGQVAAR